MILVFVWPFVEWVTGSSLADKILCCLQGCGFGWSRNMAGITRGTAMIITGQYPLALYSAFELSCDRVSAGR